MLDKVLGYNVNKRQKERFASWLRTRQNVLHGNQETRWTVGTWETD